MDNEVLDFFKLEIQKQCKFALISYRYLNDSLENIVDPSLVWYYSQNLLFATTNLSKLLWDSEDDKHRSQLRDSLNISEDSLLCDKNISQIFEYYDKKIIEWTSRNTENVYYATNIQLEIRDEDIQTENYFRNLDTTSLTLTFKGEIFKLRDLFEEIIKLNESVNKLLPTTF